jgi:hypothetical protein
MSGPHCPSRACIILDKAAAKNHQNAFPSFRVEWSLIQAGAEPTSVGQVRIYDRSREITFREVNHVRSENFGNQFDVNQEFR